MEAVGKAEAWRRRMEDQRASGQSVRAWCLANQTREHSFYWWRSRLGLSPEPRRPRRRNGLSEAPAALSRVRLVGSPAIEPLTAQSSAAEKVEAEQARELRLCLAGGRELLLPASLAMSRVAELLIALEDKSSRLENLA